MTGGAPYGTRGGIGRLAFWRRPKETYRVEMVTTFPGRGRVVLWAVAYGPTLPRIGLWIKVGEYVRDGLNTARPEGRATK